MQKMEIQLINIFWCWIHRNLMYFIMNKLIENDVYVEYKIETQIYGEIFINEKGKQDAKIKKVFAYCKFNKKTEEFSLNGDTTDKYFLMLDSKEIRHAKVQLMKRTRENKPFEQTIQIATG